MPKFIWVELVAVVCKLAWKDVDVKIQNAHLVFLPFYRFRFKTGNLEHPGDIMTNATVEVMTAESRNKAVKLQRKCKQQMC